MPPLQLPPLALPFAPAPLPCEDPTDGDIPFPVLRYEEELLAGLIMLQDQGRGVVSVDQLLALQPQCAMPPQLACYFQGDILVALALYPAWYMHFQITVSMVTLVLAHGELGMFAFPRYPATDNTEGKTLGLQAMSVMALIFAL